MIQLRELATCDIAGNETESRSRSRSDGADFAGILPVFERIDLDRDFVTDLDTFELFLREQYFTVEVCRISQRDNRRAAFDHFWCVEELLGDDAVKWSVEFGVGEFLFYFFK